MPRQSDSSADSQITTPAELNPLVNPLLAENMGRWAETYFTTPPENREQAVLDLIRQLQAEKASAGNAPGFTQKRDVDSSFHRPAEALARCPTCGHENPASHNFCGMCGAATNDPSGWTSQDVNADPRSAFDDSSVEPPPEAWDARSYGPSLATTNGLSLFRNVAGMPSDYDDTGWDYEARPLQRYRGLIGTLLAFVILGLGYLAWRGVQNSKASDVSPAPPPAVKESPAPMTATSAPAAQPVASDASNPPVSSKKTTEAPTNIPEPTAKEPERVADNRGSVPVAKPGMATRPSEAVPGQLAPGNGREELAVAQKFLGGTNGQGRDPAEASRWLWKSIAKDNTQATIPLADLYLKGDGVSKNCDQARVLLDSAARKGVSGAGERLRNLQAFGCR